VRLPVDHGPENGSAVAVARATVDQTPAPSQHDARYANARPGAFDIADEITAPAAATLPAVAPHTGLT
jgi:hypothetical protein